MKKQSTVLAAVMLGILSVPALAQQSSKPASIVLETKVGSVMTSTGGEYVSAAAGKPLVQGESMMLTDGAKATVAYYYDNGRRKCIEQYSGPNTYVIDDGCNQAAFVPNGSPGKSALVIAGAGLIGAAVLESMGKELPPQVSAGSN